MPMKGAVVPPLPLATVLKEIVLLAGVKTRNWAPPTRDELQTAFRQKLKVTKY